MSDLPSTQRPIGQFMVARAARYNRWALETKHGQPLGGIEVEPRWKKHVLVPLAGAIFSWDCLRDLSAFLLELDQAEKRHEAAKISSVQRQMAAHDYTFRLEPSEADRCFDCAYVIRPDACPSCNVLRINIADARKSRCPLWRESTATKGAQKP